MHNRARTVAYRLKQLCTSVISLLILSVQ